MISELHSFSLRSFFHCFFHFSRFHTPRSTAYFLDSIARMIVPIPFLPSSLFDANKYPLSRRAPHSHTSYLPYNRYPFICLYFLAFSPR